MSINKQSREVRLYAEQTVSNNSLGKTNGLRMYKTKSMEFGQYIETDLKTVTVTKK